MSQLAPSEEKIASFVLAHPERFVTLTVRQLAAASNGSEAAVVRLWKSLGFDGYRDFQLRVTGDLHMGLDTPYAELDSDSSFDSILKSLERSSIRSIESTLALLKEDDLRRAVDLLVAARRTLIFGVGASGVVAQDLAQKLLRIGFPVHIATDFHTAATIATQFGPQDALFAISNSGQTSEVCEVAATARESGAQVIALMRFGETPLSRLSTVSLFTGAVEPAVRAAATASRLAALVLVDTLFICLANACHDHAYRALEATRMAVRGHKLH